jgi:Cu/Ag efflux protein CusF
MESLSLARVRDLITRRKSAIGTQEGVMSPARHACNGALEGRHPLMWRVPLVLSLVACTGCAAVYTPLALTTQHPAHPEATAAPDLPPSNTLAYRPADIPSPRPAVAAGQPGARGTSPSTQKSPRTVVGEGKVIAVVPASSEIVVTHGEIKGFMDAMTMGYQIAPPSLLEGVQAGDTVRFTIDTERKAIVTLEKLQP